MGSRVIHHYKKLIRTSGVHSMANTLCVSCFTCTSAVTVQYTTTYVHGLPNQRPTDLYAINLKTVYTAKWTIRTDIGALRYCYTISLGSTGISGRTVVVDAVPMSDDVIIIIITRKGTEYSCCAWLLQYIRGAFDRRFRHQKCGLKS